MTTTIRRILSSCFVVSVTAAGLAIPAPAQAQYGQQRQAEGSHFWGQDNWCYVIQGGRPVRSTHYRVFPDPRNRSVYDIYENGQFSKRVGAPVQGRAVNPQASNEAKLQGLVNQLNGLTAQARAAQPTMMPGCPAVRPPFMAPNVRVNMPVAAHCRTAEEKRWNNQVVADTLTGVTIRDMQKNCEMRRDSQPYTSKRMGPDGVMIYVMRDGSVRREGSNLNPGWYPGMTGPQMVVCW